MKYTDKSIGRLTSINFVFVCREKMKLPMVEGDMTTMDNGFMKKKLVEESLSY